MWRELLSGNPDEIICDFLEFGWPIGYMSDTLPTFDLRTHRGALDFPDQVNAYLSTELKLGRIAGPFDTVPLAQGFVVSPLNTVEKRDSEERRVIVDLSWPCGHSLNDGIPSDSYLGKPLVLRYPTIDDIVDAVVTLGRGCHSKGVPPIPSGTQRLFFSRIHLGQPFLFRHRPHEEIALCSYGVPTLHFSRCLDQHHNKVVCCLIIWTISSAYHRL